MPPKQGERTKVTSATRSPKLFSAVRTMPRGSANANTRASSSTSRCCSNLRGASSTHGSFRRPARVAASQPRVCLRLRSGPARRGAMNASRVSDDDDDYECPSVIHASGKPGYTIKYHQEASASRRLAPALAHALKRPRLVLRAALRRPRRRVDSASHPGAVRLLLAAALPAVACA